ncbi:MAG: hypothetical protein AB7G75_34300 [Candidatus Binatia bacterium]
MKNNFFSAVFAMLTVLAVAVLVAAGCRSEAQERVVFAQNMTDPTEGFSAFTRGTEHEILVIQLPGTTLSSSDNLVSEKSVTSLRSKGFKRVEVRGSDGNMLWEKTLE